MTKAEEILRSKLTDIDLECYLKGSPLTYNACLDAVNEALNLPVVGCSLRHSKEDMIKGYQAGCIEGFDDCCDLGLEDYKEIKQDAHKWYKRFTE